MFVVIVALDVVVVVFVVEGVVVVVVGLVNVDVEECCVFGVLEVCVEVEVVTNVDVGPDNEVWLVADVVGLDISK